MKTGYKDKAASCAGKVKSVNDELSYVRDLAAMTVEIAREPRMSDILRRWRDVNSGRMPDRPPVWCKPIGCWREMLPEESVVCSDRYLRKLEYYFRQILLKRDIDDDHPVYDYFNVPAVFDVTPDPPYGFADKQHELAEAGSAWGYEAALNSPEDFDRLTIPEYSFNAARTAELKAAAESVLDGIVNVRATPLIGYFSPATICTPAAKLRGLEQLMMDMVLEPHLVHRLMEVITQGTLNYLDAIEASGTIIPNTDEPMFISDPLRPEQQDGKYTLKDCWLAGNSQEFDQVDPAMTSEFLIDYQKRIFERFGAISYGCCENLTKKIDPVLAIPNLRIFVASAWSDLGEIVKRAGDKHCIMWRHSASDVTCLETLDKVRRDTEQGVEQLKGCRYQVVLRELQSLFGRESRLYDWSQMCKEVVSR